MNETTRNFDLALEYVRCTMFANYWYEATLRYGGNLPDELLPITDARAHYYDRLACKALNQLTDDRQAVARNIYHTAYNAGKTYRDFIVEDDSAADTFTLDKLTWRVESLARLERLGG